MKKSAVVCVGAVVSFLFVGVGCSSEVEEEEPTSESAAESELQVTFINRAKAGWECGQGDGLYCGGHGVSGGNRQLFRCSSGRVLYEGMCPVFCARAPNGQNDYCYNQISLGGGDQPAPPPPAQACPYGNGMYCGGNGVSGPWDNLYSCSNGAKRLVSNCSRGCYRAPPGVNDYCK